MGYIYFLDSFSWKKETNTENKKIELFSKFQDFCNLHEIDKVRISTSIPAKSKIWQKPRYYGNIKELFNSFCKNNFQLSYYKENLFLNAAINSPQMIEFKIEKVNEIDPYETFDACGEFRDLCEYLPFFQGVNFEDITKFFNGLYEYSII